MRQPEIHWDDLQPGSGWTTCSRTVTEADLSAFINLAWLTEPLFTDHDNPIGAAAAGRLVQGSSDTLRVRSRVSELKETRKPDRGLVKFDNEVVNQKGEVVMAYSALRMLRRRP